jgi:hypothetical protein
LRGFNHRPRNVYSDDLVSDTLQIAS